MTEEELITNDALSNWLDTNHDGKWERHFGTFDSIVWNDGVVAPAESTWTSDKTTYENSISIHRTRAPKYPSLQDQLDMQYHDAVDGTTTWQDAIKAIKDANPEP